MTTTTRVLAACCLIPVSTIADDDLSWMNAPALTTEVRPIYVGRLNRYWPAPATRTAKRDIPTVQQPRDERSYSKPPAQTPQRLTASQRLDSWERRSSPPDHAARVTRFANLTSQTVSDAPPRPKLTRETLPVRILDSSLYVRSVY